jgi:hypothetical protein
MLLCCQSVQAEINDERAHSNYQIFCQGCHSPKGDGNGGVPQMKGLVGHFLKSTQGREYLVQVPGSANSALDNEQLAEVLNWIIKNFADDSAPADWRRYSAEEVEVLRQSPLLEVVAFRKNLIDGLPVKN